MFRKLRFILGVLVLAFGYAMLVENVKRFGSVELLEWFGVYIVNDIILLIGAWLAYINIGKARFSGGFIVRILAHIIVFLIMPLAVAIQAIRFVFQGGLADVFAGSVRAEKPKKVKQTTAPKATAPRDNRGNSGVAKFKLQLDRACASCRNERLYAMDSDLPNGVWAYCKNVTFKLDEHRGELYFYVDCVLCYGDVNFDIRPWAEHVARRYDASVLYDEARRLITELRKNYKGLDDEIAFRCKVNVSTEYSN